MPKNGEPTKLPRSSFGARATCDEVVSGLDLHERSYLVTGANAGIGFETARALASRGAQVFLGCRSPEAGQGAAARIVAHHPESRVSAVRLDLASFRSVRACAESLPVQKLDGVVCNAGLFPSRYQSTEDGLESTVGVCHFGHFLLVSLLLDRLKAVPGARVVVVSSESHRFPPRLDFARLPLSEMNFRPLTAYGQAKLCNVLFANEFTRRHGGDGVLANALHPGAFIGTSIFRSSGPARVFAAAISPFTKTVPQGAATSVYCAVAPELAGVGGRYFADCREKRASAEAQNQAVAARLWDLTRERVGLG